MTEKSKTEDDEDGLGCFLIIGVICLAIGAGQIWGSSVGWMAAGGAIVLFCLLYVIGRKP